MDDVQQTRPYADTPWVDEESPAHDSNQRSFVSMDGLLMLCIVPPLMGFSFVALGFYIIYGQTTLVISRSTENAAVVSQAFTAISGIWHFVALMPAISIVQRVRSEEWWRRLLETTPFNRANSVSSNISGAFAHMVEAIFARSSPYFKFSLIAAFISVVLADIAPAAIRVEVGLDPIPASFPVPALPPDSVYGNYSEPFFSTDNRVHGSIDIAPIYYNSVGFANTWVKAAPPATNALAPRPNIVPGQGYRYLTDVAFMDYQCGWYAPVLGEPESMANMMSGSENISITVGGVQGRIMPPVEANVVYRLSRYSNPSTGKPSFDGVVAFGVTSGKQSPDISYFNLSSVPTAALSPSWQAAAAAWKANQTGPAKPVTADTISVAMCSPKYSIESWIIDLVNGSTRLVQPQLQRVGNLDTTQLNIAIQDSFIRLTFSSPLSVTYGMSVSQLFMLFDMPHNTSLPGIPKPSEKLTRKMNAAIPTFVQAYLDNFPFGDFVPLQSKLLVPALILSAQLNFICATTALYALLSGVLFYLFRRTVARPFTITSVLSVTRETEPHTLDAYCGRAVANMAERIAVAGSGVDGAETEARINTIIGDRYTLVREDLVTKHMTLELDSQQRSGVPSPLRERYENIWIRNSRFSWAFTPTMGAMLVALGISVYRHPRVVSKSPQNTTAVLFSALFTWGLGLWRSLSLLAVSSLVRQANSDEWSRLLQSHRRHGLSQRLRGLFDIISTNTLSFADAFRAACMTRTSIFFKVCYSAALLAPLCAVLAQGAITLLVLPSLTNQELTIPFLAIDPPIEVPWSADGTLAPYNGPDIAIGQLGTSWTYLEQIVGSSVGDTMPPGYLIPLRTHTNNTVGSQYPTDVAHIQCECNWVALQLPPPIANVSYIPVSLDSVGIKAIQTVPLGISLFAPLSNITFFNGTPVTSGMFAWTLWGGGPGDSVNLASIPSTQLSQAWQGLIANQTAPALIKSQPGNARYLTNLTRAATLVCDPRLQFMPKLARAFGGLVNLAKVPPEYGTGVGNIDKAYVAWMIHNYAVQQSRDITGRFRSYTVFGLAIGNATLMADPDNPVGGTVPKSTAEIGSTLDAYIGSSSKAWMAMDLAPNTTTVNGQIIQQSLIVTAALPQVLAAGVLYLLLSLAGLLVSLRTPEAPFTLAGILMMHSRLATLQLLPSQDKQEEKPEK